MPFIPHTPDEIEAMLATIGVKSIKQLFDEIPASLSKAKLENIAEGLNEWEITRLMNECVPHSYPGSCFLGAGAYEHHIPAAIWEIVGRGEFYTAYTPYQAEASQGTLQVIYEYQTMMANLMGMEVSNASLYDGASALAESVLMAIRIKQNRGKRVLVPMTLHPNYRRVLHTILKLHDISLEELPYSPKEGNISMGHVQQINPEGLAAIIIPQPNFFGVLEEVDELTDMTHQLDAMVIAVVNPIAMALLKEPGKWGRKGADIVCGEGQPLGVPLASGGPYFGFMCCNKRHVRQLPGRIVGKTEDKKGRIGYTLTLQTREQHIRRAKATSNICTNQGLLVVAATIYLSLLGAKGLRNIAAVCHHNACQLFDRLTTIESVTSVFSRPIFHEFVIRFNQPAELIVKALMQFDLQAGYLLKSDYPELGECLLVCATETKTIQDLERYQQLLSKCLTTSTKE